MISPEVLVKWKRQAHDPRVQVKAISYIASKMAMCEAYMDMVGKGMPKLEEILKDCNVSYTPDVSVPTRRHSWNLYEERGELPHKVAEQNKRMTANNIQVNRNELLDDGDILTLKEIVDKIQTYIWTSLRFYLG